MINDFPTELLQDIFLLSTQSQEQLYSPPSLCCCSTTSTCVISKTCKRWRDVALNFPPLWTHIHVVDPQQVSIVQDLQDWMHRAGTLPVCLSLRQHQSYDKEASVAVVALFLKSLHHCRSFELFTLINLNSYISGVDRLFRDQNVWSYLEAVNVWCPQPPTPMRTTARWLAKLLLQNHTPRLRTIRWSWVLGRPFSPWENLREFSTRGLADLEEALHALSQCQNLERLKIHGPTPVDYITPPVALPRVTHLSVLLDYTWIALLERLILPSLANLEIVLLNRLVWAPILELIQRSDVILSGLGILSMGPPEFQRIYQDELISALKMPCMRELRFLEITEPIILGGIDLTEFLTLPTSGGSNNDGNFGYLVHLERVCLVFQGAQGLKISPSLRKLAESRLGTLYDLKTVGKHIELTTTQIRFSLSIPTA